MYGNQVDLYIAKPAQWNFLDKYLNHDVVLGLNSKPHETCLHNTLEVFIRSAETQSWMVNEKMSFKVLSDLDLETWVRLAVYGCKHQKLVSLLVKESNRVWQCEGLTTTCTFAIIAAPSDTNFDVVVALVQWKEHRPDHNTWNIEISLKIIQLYILEAKYVL